MSEETLLSTELRGTCAPRKLHADCIMDDMRGDERPESRQPSPGHRLKARGLQANSQYQRTIPLHDGDSFMTRTLLGVIHGRTVELSEDLGVADGQQVEITIKTVASPKPWGEGLRRCAVPSLRIGPRRTIGSWRRSTRSET